MKSQLKQRKAQNSSLDCNEGRFVYIIMAYGLKDTLSKHLKEGAVL